jgi:tetratricopeptide (TPR) repeat protein
LKAVRLLVLIFIIAACNSSRHNHPNASDLYNEFLRIDSLAKINSESAFYYYNKAAAESTDSTYKGTYLQRMALMQQDSAGYNGSNESAMKSLLLFNKKNRKHFPNISYNYNLLAANCRDLGRYDDALKYYDSAFQYADSSNMPIFMNNKGVVYQTKKDYKEAIQFYEKALREFRSDTLIQAMIQSNLAISRWLDDSGYPAANELHEARNTRELMNDKLGLNASYSYLADFYQLSNPDSAAHYAKKMYDVAKELNRADDQAEALEKLIRLSSGPALKNYFVQYDLLTDSIHLARTNASNQFADIRYNAEEARANNLLLEKDNTQKKLRITRQRIIIYSTLIMFSGLIFFGVLWYRKRKRLQDMQTRNAVRESELKTSKKVHDVVANGLYRIMTELEHKEDIDKEQILDKIELLYEQSRDISYEKSTETSTNYSKLIYALLTSFASESVKVFIAGNDDVLWKAVPVAEKKELEAVLLELMVNMTKHSQANNVVVKFSLNSNTLLIQYQDDGIGLKNDFAYGNGLINTGNRIKGLGGRITFESSIGLKIELSIPI